jgi:hypothetical protein
MSVTALEPGGWTKHATDAERAAFLARTTAGAMHEFRNVLAIVRESAGLVQDLVAVSGPGGPSRERVLGVLGRIEAQVVRGAELSTSLSRVVHGLDRPEERVDVMEALHHAVVLTRRYARQRGRWLEPGAGVGGEADRGGASAGVAGSSPSVVHGGVAGTVLDTCMGLMAALEWAVERVPEGGTLVVGVEWSEGRPVVRFTGQPSAVGGGESDAESRRRLEASLAWLPARVEYSMLEPLRLCFL